jgi:hypothetical protein
MDPDYAYKNFVTVGFVLVYLSKKGKSKSREKIQEVYS